jgi:hypothetical protein
MTEGFNNKIKLIQRMAYGLRNEHNRQKRILASNSRSVLKILCDVCRKPLSEQCDDLFLALVTIGMASLDARLRPQPLLAFVEAEFRHRHGLPEEAVTPED